MAHGYMADGYMADGYDRWQMAQWSRKNGWEILPLSASIANKTGRFRLGFILEPFQTMESRIISERAFGFACRIVRLCERWWGQGGASRKIADQLFGSGTSIGANVAESRGGHTKPDFLAKMAIARKESWETIYWLELAIATSVTTKEEVAWELDEARQLRAMITAAIRTGQSSTWRGGA
jgi:four helix bundle protein